SGIRLGSILLCAGRARPQLIVVVVEVVEESVVPLRRVIGPGTLEPARDCVVALAAAKPALPAEPLLLQACAFRLRTHVLGGRGPAVGLRCPGPPGGGRHRPLRVPPPPGQPFVNCPPRRGRGRVAPLAPPYSGRPGQYARRQRPPSSPRRWRGVRLRAMCPPV